MDVSLGRECSVNGKGSSFSQSDLYQQATRDKKRYRLTIRIDKLYGKPGPRSKKVTALMQVNEDEEIPMIENNVELGDRSLQVVNKNTVCAVGGCKLKNSFYQSQPAFQCELCNKYYHYATKICDKPPKNSYPRIASYQSLAAIQSLHNKSNLICDMCQTECSCQVTYAKHTKLHVSTDPLRPYKCHRCVEVFELKDDLRHHCVVVHPTIKFQNVGASSIARDYRCEICNFVFKNEQYYRSHVKSHKKEEALTCSISETNNIFPVPNPLTGSQIGILRAVKFSCTVCSMEFDNVGEVDKHTRTHLEEPVEDDRNCNICKKVFKTSSKFNEHLKNHLSRAHPCPLCAKAFINKTTLNIHLKTHGEYKS